MRVCPYSGLPDMLEGPRHLAGGEPEEQEEQEADVSSGKRYWKLTFYVGSCSLALAV